MKAVLIHGMATTDADIVINVSNIFYDSSGLFRTSGAVANKIKNGMVNFGENNMIPMPSGTSNSSIWV